MTLGFVVPAYAYYALGSAIGLAALSLVSKALVRYRFCNADLVTWTSGMCAGLLGVAVWLVAGVSFPVRAVWPLLGVCATVQLALWLVNRAIQEGDLSTVVPLLSTKIPFAAVMAFVILGERYGLGTYGAVALAGAGAVLFALGRPQAAQGGHGRHPVVSILLAVAGAATFALADQLAKLGIDRVAAMELLVWSLIIRGVFCAAMTARPVYRQYRITKLDWLLLLAGGALTVAVLAALYKAFQLSGGVTLTNVILGTRGLFGLVLGATLGRLLRVPLESQPVRIYLLRVAGTALLAAAMAIVLAN